MFGELRDGEGERGLRWERAAERGGAREVVMVKGRRRGGGRVGRAVGSVWSREGEGREVVRREKRERERGGRGRTRGIREDRVRV